ncbi:protein phosphatase 1 regulatory subunit 29-like [Denticeps clupeoides]|uniref:LRRCT domain-containing protein n=1 Tax=Denticeps clupeoides TaxID=299321 RepID=A0AAY4ECJ4_9TELE|nr:protein phosphatase 1 regulatory subunit 29-like [Denticeps clupeoides]XP_028829988.1 protein phosphatase 1 regulatory subunit 29-like [Denticeps clupeoides]XP_028829989.1 protein phosphatase 1 regulatory subunit 29-like [Denticeps clupeoides]XP_028829990.1 protein phosphatase 1 regulatory subunit 29-like [Denticeps clupeoides]XP_028829992.1 protein phosphatase 1 regulatory subunit 29-like [Denticeps clupeoides]XP_028829993.1 protein phosphatase 1 regulatory subunit 29-like [Denticeps clupe
MFYLCRVFSYSLLITALPLLIVLRMPDLVHCDCWLIEGDKGYVWLAICSQNQPPYETIPQHINNTVHDLRLNENKLKAIFFTSLSRFTNLTDLNLTKNEISYIEDGAFAGQANLQVLQLGYNKLFNLTEGMLRGLGRLHCLFLQHNLLEAIATNAFWECPSLSSVDLSSNRLARLEPSTFTVLGRLTECELAGNPFHCGCELYSFLTWLEAFNNVTHTYDRLQCETPKEFFGYPLLSPNAGHGRNARNMLASMCRDGVIITASLPPDFISSGIGPDDRLEAGSYHQPTASISHSTYSPSLKLQTVTLSTASLLVQIPKPYSKMYILTQYNHTSVADVMNLKMKTELITLKHLSPHTNYTFCVASIRNSQRYNHTCLDFATRASGPNTVLHTRSTTTHYIMTILGCLFGMVIVLGLVYFFLRRRRMQEEMEKAISVKNTILEMRYGPEVAAAAASNPSILQMPLSTTSSKGLLLSSTNTSSSRLSSLPQVSNFSEAMATSKGNYMEVRTSVSGEEHVRDSGEAARGAEDGEDAGDSDDNGRGSSSEISTIAKEVDKVNQIINNCIDALKLDSAAVAAAAAAVTTTADDTVSPPSAAITALAKRAIPLSPGITDTCQIITSPKIPSPAPRPLVLPLSERPGISGGGFLSPPYRDPPPVTAARPLQRQLSADAAGIAIVSQKTTRVFSLDVPDACGPDSRKYPEVESPTGCGESLERHSVVSVQKSGIGGGSGGSRAGGGGGEGSGGGGGCGSVRESGCGGDTGQQHRLEVQPDYHCSEHRHSFPALFYEGVTNSPNQRASFLKPLAQGKRDTASYSQLSPCHRNYSGYSSSPEYSAESTLKIWERFRPYRKSPRDEASYIAAGHALRKKVQFARGEDLHDILDYWKGVSAHQKL